MKLVKTVVHKGTSQPQLGEGREELFGEVSCSHPVLGGFLHNPMLQLDHQVIPLLH